MNEVIKKIAEQARIQMCSDARLQEFAELLIQECCEVLGKETIRHDGYGYNQHALYQKIKQHFGVEE